MSPTGNTRCGATSRTGRSPVSAEARQLAFRGAGGGRRGLGTDVALLKAEHQRLLEAVRRVRDRPLGRIPPEGRRWTYGELLLGIAAHDAYHTGQIQLLKRLWQERAGWAGGVSRTAGGWRRVCSTTQ